MTGSLLQNRILWQIGRTSDFLPATRGQTLDIGHHRSTKTRVQDTFYLELVINVLHPVTFIQQEIPLFSTSNFQRSWSCKRPSTWKLEINTDHHVQEATFFIVVKASVFFTHTCFPDNCIIPLNSRLMLKALSVQQYFVDIYNIKRLHERKRKISSHRGLLGKLTVSQLFKNFISFYRIQMFISVFTKAQNIHILSQMYLVYIFTSYFFKISFSIILPSMPRPSKFSVPFIEALCNIT